MTGIRFYFQVMTLFAGLIIGCMTANAQTTLLDASQVGVENQSLPTPLNREALRNVLSTLTDSEVRDLLLRELDTKIAESEAKQRAENSFIGEFGEWGQALAFGLYEPFTLVPNIPDAIAVTYQNFITQRDGASLTRLVVYLIFALGGGAIAYYVVGRFVDPYEKELLSKEPPNLWAQIYAVSVRFVFQLLKITAFLGCVYIVNTWLNTDNKADNTLIRFIAISVWWTLFAVIIARFLLSPQRPHLRLCHMDDKMASFLTFRVGLIFGWSAFTLSMLPRLAEFGWNYGETRLGFWFNLIFHLLVVLTIWQARVGITSMVRGKAETISHWWERFSSIWPGAAIGLVILEWIIVELYVATGNLANLSIAAINTTLAILLMLPLIDQAVSAIVRAIWQDDKDTSEERQAILDLERDGAGRCLRLIVLFIIIVALFALWGISWKDLASQGFGAKIAGSFTEILLILVVAYAFWEALNILTARQIIVERAVLKQDPKYDPAYGVTRLETVLPLIKGAIKATIFTLAALAILGEIGVNVLPLLAGAGVVGLAIGFGAQTLVRDIISGIFFLIDDAFRKDEYIDIGTCMGTVERLSIRSMQLRHHDGLLHTIPFGEIGQVANYSRDWGIMRLFLRVTYDTDVEKLADLINTLGVELLEDETIGQKFDVKLTAEGVVDTDDSALIFRCAYKTKALDQWAMRGRIYSRIREMFKREGIHFANREVTVRVKADTETQLSDDDLAKIGAAAEASLGNAS